MPRRVVTLALFACTACGEPAAPAPPAPPAPTAAPAPALPPPPTLAPTTRAALGAALSRAATSATGVEVAVAYTTQSGHGGSTLHLEHDGPALRGWLACTILGQPREVVIEIPAAESLARVAALARVVIAENAEESIASPMLHDIGSRTITIDTAEGPVVFTTESSLPHATWRVTAGDAVGYTESPEVEALAATLRTAAHTDRCDLLGAGEGPRPSARFGIPEVPPPRARGL
jgi:hypothetical protein